MQWWLAWREGTTRRPEFNDESRRAPGPRVRRLAPALACAAAALLQGCLSGELERERALLAEARSRAELPQDDIDAILGRGRSEWPTVADLASRVVLQEVVNVTLARNPDGAAALERWVAALERPAQRMALPDPQASYAYSSMFRMHTVKLEQGLPFPGKLLAEGRAALAEARAMRAEQAAVQNLLREQATAAVAWLALARQSLALVDESVALLERIVAVAHSRYQSGAVQQSDVLRVEVDLAGLRAERALRAQAVEAAESALNALVDRPVDAPLGPVVDPGTPPPPASLQALLERALHSHPDLGAARARWDAAEAMRDRADQEWIPDFMLGGGYVRDFGMDEDQLELMGGISLPLWWGKITARIRETEADVRRTEAEARSARNRILDDVRRSRSRLLAAQQAALLLRGDAVPKAAQNVSVSEASYTAGRIGLIDLLDAQRALLMRQLELSAADAEVAVAGAALLRAVGGPDGHRE